MSPRLPTNHRILPSAVTFTPFAGTPSLTGGLANCASQPTAVREIWHRVLPDLGSMNTEPCALGSSVWLPGGDVGVSERCGPVGVGDGSMVGGVRLGRGVGTMGSVGLVGA